MSQTITVGQNLIDTFGVERLLAANGLDRPSKDWVIFKLDMGNGFFTLGWVPDEASIPGRGEMIETDNEFGVVDGQIYQIEGHNMIVTRVDELLVTLRAIDDNGAIFGDPTAFYWPLAATRARLVTLT